MPAPSPPSFWTHKTLLGTVLSPLGTITKIATARRLRRPGWRAPIPVLCVGNVTVGGAGKTTVALDLARRLLDRDIAVAFLTRGYGGATRGPLRVDPERHTAALTGDEPLLLAALAPTWIAADRAAGARAAIAAGAELLIMDDGLQNPTLHKTLSLLLIDGATGFGNGHLLPAGPLREPIAIAATRCAAAILIGPDQTNAAAQLPPSLPVLRVTLRQSDDLSGRRVLAFAGIAHPDKFWTTLQAAGATLAAKHPFPDHHRYGEAELTHLLAEAHRLDAEPVTTPKDAVRLPPAIRAKVTSIGVSLTWDDPAALDRLLPSLFADRSLGLVWAGSLIGVLTHVWPMLP